MRRSRSKNEKLLNTSNCFDVIAIMKQVDLLKLYIKGKEARCNLNDQVAEVGLNDN